MGTVLRAITGGAVSTTVMVVTLLVVDIETRSRLSLFEAIARFVGVPGNTGLGFIVFLAFGVVVWPLLFAFLEPYLPPAHDSAVSGMLFASALWVAFMLVGTAEITVILVAFYAAVTLLAHLAYGFTLGLVYGWDGWTSDASTTGINTSPERDE
jgi:hypothetical protein